MFDTNPTKRVVEPLTMAETLDSADGMLMTLIPHIINGNAGTIATILAATDPTNPKSLLKSGALYAAIYGGEKILNVNKLEGDTPNDIGKLIFGPMLKDQDTTIAIFSISSPVLDYVPNKHVNNFAMQNSQVYVRITRPTLNTDGSKLRTVEISLRLGAKLKNINKYVFDEKGKKIVAGRARNFNIGGVTNNITTRLVTTEDRLERILLGKEPFPNPFTGENLSTEDSVTIDGSEYGLAMTEFRLTGIKLATKNKKNGLVNKVADKAKVADDKVENTGIKDAFANSTLGLGVSIQGVAGIKSGSRVVVQMSNANDGTQRAMIYSGSSTENNYMTLAGGIIDPALDLSAQKYTGMQAGYVRALIGDEDVINKNRLNWVEVNMSTKEGRAIYARAMKTGYIPIAGKDEKIDGVVSHGQLTFDSHRNAKTLKTTQFYKKFFSKPDGLKKQFSTTSDILKSLKTKIVGQELLASQFKEPYVITSIKRQFSVHHAANNSVLKQEGITTSNPGGEHYYNNFPYSSGVGNKDVERFTDNALIYNANISGDLTQQDSSMHLLALRNSKNTLISTLQKEIDTPNVKTFKEINLFTPRGIFKGQDAIDYLKKHNHSQSFSSYKDEISTIISMNDTESVDDFFVNFKKDLEEYQKEESSTFVGKWVDDAGEWTDSIGEWVSSIGNSNSGDSSNESKKDLEKQNKVKIPNFADRWAFGVEKWIDDNEYSASEYGFTYLDPDNIKLAQKISKTETPKELGYLLANTELGELTELLTDLNKEYPIELNLHVDY